MTNSEVSRLSVSTVRPTVILVAGLCALMSGCASLTGPERLTIPANTADFRTRLYTGASVGNSHLNPDTSGTRFTVDSTGDIGTQLRLGYDVHNLLAVELDTSVLGTSKLVESNTDVKYSSASVSALVYALNGVQMRSRREGLSAYGRVGLAALKKSSAVIPLEESGTVPILGLGAEYGFSNGLGMRAEITRFDDDVSYFGLGAIYRFGISPAGIGQVIAEAAKPASRNSRLAGNVRDSSGSNDVRHVSTAAGPWRPGKRADDRDSDGVLDPADKCPDTTAYVTVDQFGCGLFDAVLSDVTFKSGSRWLSPRARGQLDSLAETLLVFPESRVQIRAHTDSKGPADLNLSLSSRRAEAVVQYLQSRGVHELQLEALGMGEAQPLDSNADEEGRRRNRRVEVLTLADQDAQRMMVASRAVSARLIAADEQASGNGFRGEYDVAVENWNSKAIPEALDREGGGTAMANAEPGLGAARSVFPPLQVAPLPMPGYVPGLSIAGVVGGVSFAPGSAVLDQDAQQALGKVADELHNFPQVRIAIMAHTDDSGDSDQNTQLSKSRAESVKAYLSQSGIVATRMRAEGYGDLLPLVQNVTDEDRARNRRVEIRVMR